MYIFGMVHIVPCKNGTLVKYYKHIKHSYKEKFKIYLIRWSFGICNAKLSNGIVNSAVREIFTNGTIDEGSHSCDKMTL